MTRARQARRRTPAPKGDIHLRVGRLLRDKRIAKGWSQAQLGSPHFSRALISAAELGKVGLSLSTLAFLARKLEMPCGA
jgi:transcriptional regulator with XRE-family HTH domain